MTDVTIVSKLEELARKLEAKAGIPVPLQTSDGTPEAKLQRIINAIDDFVGSIETHSLTEHTDVTIASPQNHQVLEHNGIEWVNAFQWLSGHADVNSSLAPSSNYALLYDGASSKWDARTLVNLLSIKDLSDVSDSMTPSTGHFLKFSLSQWISDVIQLTDLEEVYISSPMVGDHLLVGNAGAWTNFSLETTLKGAGFIHEDGTIPLIAQWNAAQNILAPLFKVDATIDHEIGNSSDDLTITNYNQDKDIVFNVDKGGTQYDFLKIDASVPSLLIDPGTVVIQGYGIIDIAGSWSVAAGAFGLMSFRPTITGGQAIGFVVNPTYDINANIAVGMKLNPAVGSGLAGATMAVTGVQWAPGSAPAGKTETYIGFEDNTSRILLSASTWNHTGIKLGGAALVANAGAALTDVLLDLYGGVSLAAGTCAQYGIKMTGLGNILAGAPTMYAIYSDGGTIAWAADNAEFRMGAEQDTRMYYDGSDYILDPDVVGTGRVLIGATGDDDMLLTNLEVDGDFDHDGTKIGFFGTAPAVQSAAYTPSNVTPDRSFDADATTLDEVADVLGTLIADLQSYGLLA